MDIRVLRYFLAVEVPAEDGGTEWCEPVDAEDYERLK